MSFVQARSLGRGRAAAILPSLPTPRRRGHVEDDERSAILLGHLRQQRSSGTLPAFLKSLQPHNSRDALGVLQVQLGDGFFKAQPRGLPGPSEHLRIYLRHFYAPIAWEGNRRGVGLVRNPGNASRSPNPARCG